MKKNILLPVVLLFLQACPVYSVSFDNSAFTTVSNGTYMSVDINISATDGMLLAELCKNAAVIDSVAEISYDNTAMHFVTSVAHTNLIETDIYILLRPAAGTHPVSVTFTGTDYAMLNVISYADVSGIGAISVKQATAASLSCGMTTTVDGSWIAGICGVRAFTNIAVMGSGWTTRINSLVASDRAGISFDAPAPIAGPYAPDFTNNASGSLCIAAVELMPNLQTPTIPPAGTQTPVFTVTNTFTATQSPTVTPAGTAQPPFMCFETGGNFPNPFKDKTEIVFYLCRETTVRLQIFTINGEALVELNESRDAGNNSIIWDGRNAAGMPVPGGIYIYNMSAITGNDRIRKTGILVKEGRK